MGDGDDCRLLFGRKLPQKVHHDAGSLGVECSDRFVGEDDPRRRDSTLALAGILMAALTWQLLATVFVAAIGFALVLDQIKRPVMAAFKLG